MQYSKFPNGNMLKMLRNLAKKSIYAVNVTNNNELCYEGKNSIFKHM